MKSRNFTSLLPSFTLTLILALAVVNGFAQGNVWTEDFSLSPCKNLCPANGYVGISGTWTTMSTGANGTTPNIWYVSGAENAGAVGVCGDSGAHNTLHLSNVPGSSTAEFFCKTGDCGADYDAGGGSGGTIYSSTRAVSPVINLTGRTNVSITFNYIEGGNGTSDNMTIDYSNDGGATWGQLADPPKTSNAGCPGVMGLKKGKWTSYTVQLPSSANNNPNFKIGFNWTNGEGNDDDPSAAIGGVHVTTSSDGDGISETEFSNAIQIFPNPFTNQFTISTGSVIKESTAFVYDVTGKEIYSSKLNGTGSTQINIPGLSNGIYLLKVISADGNVAVKKLVRAE